MNNYRVFTPDDILYTGLTLVGFTEDRLQVCRDTDTSLVQFRSHYGSKKSSCHSELCEDLQTTNIAEARVDDMKVHYFLMSIHFLKCYPTAEQQSALFKVDEKTARKWTRSGSRALYIFSSSETEKGEKVLSVGKTFVQICRIPKQTFEISKEDNACL
jgi:hypothetical protein